MELRCCHGFALAVICISLPVDDKASQRKLYLCVSMYWCLCYSASAWMSSTYAALLFKYTPPSLFCMPLCLGLVSLPLYHSLSLIIISPAMSLWSFLVALLHTLLHTIFFHANILQCNAVLLAFVEL